MLKLEANSRLTSKTISVTEGVYDIREKEKRPGESFSEELTRLVKDRGKIADLAGAWSNLTDEELASIERGMEEIRKSANMRVMPQ